MTARVSPTEAIRAEIDDLIAGAERGSLLEHFEEVARAAVRLVFQTALESEVTEFFGRERYARGEREQAGSRNGYSPMTIKTTAGEVTLQRPKTRGTEVAFASRLLGAGVTRTNALEALVIAGFVRGLSVRDVEASLADALGPESTVSKSTVSRICEAIKDEFDTWKTRDLSGIEVDYFFADGSYFRMHPGAPAEPVLVAWGITSGGKPVFLGMEPGSSESHDAWAGFFRGLKDRGLGDPLLVISDGGQGLIGAAEIVFSHSLRQRCLIHRARIDRPSGTESSGQSSSAFRSMRRRCRSRASATRWWRAVSSVHPRSWASSRRAVTSASCPDRTSWRSGSGTKLSHCSQMFTSGTQTVTP